MSASSGKPFCQGMRCRDLEGLRVRATFSSGAVVEGALAGNGAIRLSTGWFVALSMGNGVFMLRQDVESVEPLDKELYEYVDDLSRVRVGDTVFYPNGNRFLVNSVGEDTLGIVLDCGAEATVSKHEIAYARRPKPRMPDAPGLWKTAEGRVVLYDGEAIQWLQDTDGEWMAELPPISLVDAIEYAPFSPYRQYKREENHE